MPVKLEDRIKKALLERAPDRRISCQEARQVAEELGTDYAGVGAACNDLGIRIHGCALGCF